MSVPEQTVLENLVHGLRTLLPSLHIEHGLHVSVSLIESEYVPFSQRSHFELCSDEHGTVAPYPGGHVMHWVQVDTTRPPEPINASLRK